MCDIIWITKMPRKGTCQTSHALLEPGLELKQSAAPARRHRPVALVVPCQSSTERARSVRLDTPFRSIKPLVNALAMAKSQGRSVQEASLGVCGTGDLYGQGPATHRGNWRCCWNLQSATLGMLNQCRHGRLSSTHNRPGAGS